MFGPFSYYPPPAGFGSDASMGGGLLSPMQPPPLMAPNFGLAQLPGGQMPMQGQPQPGQQPQGLRGLLQNPMGALDKAYSAGPGQAPGAQNGAVGSYLSQGNHGLLSTALKAFSLLG